MSKVKRIKKTKTHGLCEGTLVPVFNYCITKQAQLSKKIISYVSNFVNNADSDVLAAKFRILESVKNFRSYEFRILRTESREVLFAL